MTSFKKHHSDQDKALALRFHDDLFHDLSPNAIPFQGISTESGAKIYNPLSELYNLPSKPIYVNASSVTGRQKTNANGNVITARENEDCVALHAIILEDIGTKINPNLIKANPSYIIESSQNNYQYIYILENSIQDLTFAERILNSIKLHHPPLTDLSSVSTYNRMFRMPLGVHGKPTDDTDEEYNFPVRIKAHNIDPTTNNTLYFEPLQLLHDLGVTLISDKQQQETQTNKISDPLLIWLIQNNYSPETTEQFEWHKVMCPRHDEHTTKTPYDAGYAPPSPQYENRRFKCHHAHNGNPPDTRDFLDYYHTLGAPESPLHTAPFLKTNEDGKIFPILPNAIILLQQQPIILQHNTFSNKITMQGTYQSLPRPIEDSDHINFRVALSTNHNVEFNRIIMQDAISYVARQNPYHPVRNFIEQQQWDHQQRAEQIFIKHQQADDTPLNRILTRKWLLAVVNRIYRPGCKFDHVLFLTGAEGTGKSSMWRALAIRDEWFTELETTEAKDVVEQTTGKMIVELSEGIVLDSRSKNQVKSMLSRQSPTVRMAYGHNAQEFPIQFCFAGCHNQHEFARDDDGSGLRRFWTIPIHRKANNPYDWTSFIADIPQIWAEVKTWYDQGELLEIPKEHMEALNAQRNLSIVQDDWEQDVINFLDGQISSRLDGKSEVKNRVCIKQIALEALSLDYGKMPRYDGNRIKNIMNKQTNWKHNGSKNMDMKQYGAQKGWYRLDTNNYEKGE